MRIKALFLLLILPVFLLLAKPLLSEDYTNKPSLSMSIKDRYVKGVVAYSSREIPNIQINSYKISGAAKLEIYKATIDDVLKYLVHDKDYKQISPQVDTGKLERFTELDVNLKEGSQIVDLHLPSSGIFFIRLIKDDLKSQTFVIRSMFGSITRESKDNLIVWSQDFETKRSLNGGKATLYNLEKQKLVLGSMNLDGDGVASLPLSKSADVVVVENENSLALVPINARYLNSDYFWYSFQENQKQKKFFIFTDRPIYKPGDTVKFKAIVRDDDDARYSLPSGLISVEASQGWENKKYLYKDRLPIDVNGFISSSFTIPKNATTGEYQIALNIGDNLRNNGWEYHDFGDRLYFMVENYRKPEYSINAESNQIDVIKGDVVRVNINGQYYSGQPLANTDIEYKVRASDYGYYESEVYYPDNGNHYYRGWWGNEIDGGSVKLDSKGKAYIDIPTNKNDSKGKYQTYFIEFNYTDDTGNPAWTGVNVLVRSGEFSLYKENYDSWGGKPGQTLEIPFIVKANRQGLSLSQNIEINISRNWWQQYNDPNSKYPRYKQIIDQLGEQNLKTDSSGKAKFEFKPEKEGNYNLETVITDTKGNKIIKSFYLWVDNKYSNYNSDSPTTIRVIPDGKSYIPGDTALINVVSEIPDRDVFLGFDRSYQDRYQIVRLEGKEKTIESKIFDHDMPNIYLTAKSFGDNTLDGDVQNISVNTDSRKVVFSLSTDKKNYAPGDEVSVNIKATDLAGNPLETNFALWSVDKSIFALADKNYGDIFDKFWSERYNYTSQAHSLEGIMIEPAAEMGGCFTSDTMIKMADGGLKRIEEVKKGDEILTLVSQNSKKLVKTKVTATHQTSVPGYLIINGNFKVTSNHIIYINRNWHRAGTVQIGDELTSIQGKQVKVVSLEYINGKTKVHNLTTEKYHTFFADDFYVHNDKDGGTRESFADTAYWNASVNTNSEGKAQVKFRLPDNLTTWVITTLGATYDTKVGEAFTEIKANKDLVIRPVLPNLLNSEDSITISALVHNFTDIESKVTADLKTDAGQIISDSSVPVKVGANDFVIVKWDLTVGQAKEAAKFEFQAKDNLNRSDGIVQRVDIRDTGFWDQFSEFKQGSSKFTINFPDKNYDQQKSYLELSLSSTVLGSLPSAMNYLINYPYGCAEQTTSSLLPKIVARKYPDVFAEALSHQSSNQTVDDGLDKLAGLQNYDGGWAWWNGSSDPFVTAYVFRLLNEAKNIGVEVDETMYAKTGQFLLKDFDSSDLNMKTIRAFGLSFAANKEMHKLVEGQLNLLSDDYLAMAVIANLNFGIKDPNINGISLLLGRMKTSNLGNYWQAGSRERFGSNEASTALAVQALTKAGGYNTEIAKAINYLVANRHHDYWSNTYATAQTILAITEFSQIQKEAQTDIKYSVKKYNDKILASGRLAGLQSSSKIIKIDASKLDSGADLIVDKEGQGEIYTTLTQKWWIKDTTNSKVSHGVTVTKKLVNHKGEEYNLTPGDLVDVILEVSYDNPGLDQSNYAILEDHLPAGLVPVNTHLLNESGGREMEYKEYLSDGVRIPIYYGYKSKVYKYQARVISSGSFYNPPAFFSLMYYPEIWSRSDAGMITVDNDVKINPIIRAKSMLPKAIKNGAVVKLGWLVVTAVLVLIAIVVKNYVKKIKNRQP